MDNFITVLDVLVFGLTRFVGGPSFWLCRSCLILGFYQPKSTFVLSPLLVSSLLSFLVFLCLLGLARWVVLLRSMVCGALPTLWSSSWPPLLRNTGFFECHFWVLIYFDVSRSSLSTQMSSPGAFLIGARLCSVHKIFWSLRHPARLTWDVETCYLLLSLAIDVYISVVREVLFSRHTPCSLPLSFKVLDVLYGRFLPYLCWRFTLVLDSRFWCHWLRAYPDWSTLFSGRHFWSRLAYAAERKRSWVVRLRIPSVFYL